MPATSLSAVWAEGSSSAALNRRTTAPRVLFVASSGGHVAELRRRSRRIPYAPSSLWLTFDTPQTRSMLGDEAVEFVPYVRPRDLVGTLGTCKRVARLLRRERFDLVVSTGAAVAVGAFVAARVSRVPAVYIESIARVRGPSVTGRLVALLRLAELRTPHERWAHGRWRLVGGLFDDVPIERDRPVSLPPERPRLFVTLGTIRPYRFDRLVDAVLATGLADEHTVWQLGSTVRNDLPGRAAVLLDADDFAEAVAEADVVITHAGVGTILELLDAGVHPVVVPRRVEYGEHVDDHQVEIAESLRGTAIVTVVDVERLSAEHVTAAAGRLIGGPA